MGTCCGDSKDKKDKNGRLYCSAEETTVTSVTKKFGNACCEMPRGALRYVGERYITKFADPIQWDANRAYEQIEAVQHEGFTYISKQPVPAGVQIDNEDFWLLWADPNAQMEQLRQFVVHTDSELREFVTETDAELREYVDTYDQRITQNAEDIAKLNEKDIWLLVGDSWCNFNTQVNWTGQIASDFNLEMRNYAVGGTGYNTGTRTFILQLQQAVGNMTAEDIERVKRITILGGVNDAANNNVTPSDISTYISACLAYIEDNFPNAMTYIGFNMPGISYTTAANNAVARSIMLMANRVKNWKTNTARKFVFINTHLFSLSALDEEIYKNESGVYLHLNSTGANLFCEYVYQAFLGNIKKPSFALTTDQPQKANLFTANDGSVNVTGSIELIDGICRISNLTVAKVAENVSTGNHALTAANNRYDKLLRYFNIVQPVIYVFKPNGAVPQGWINLNPASARYSQQSDTISAEAYAAAPMIFTY